MPLPERLQKIIAQAGIASRRDAEELIVSGRVSVNGRTVTQLGAKAVFGRDKITVDGKKLHAPKNVYILLNKPKSVVTTLKDPQNRKTVADLVADVPERIFPVGRLDYNTEGLLLLTNDGELARALTHPSSQINKTYQVKVKGTPREEELDILRTGIKLDDVMTEPAIVNVINIDRAKNITTLEVVIHEGKNRQVRRMFETIGYNIRNLKRVKLASLDLSGLHRGQYRHLHPDEVEALRKLAL